ncbi:hypothetical protein DFH07DRAFT_851517 [Mycena maculata]|uniref:Uncharacterized protein n=1 Tax=Mycena maculata TaxID=230809 RepID=A0AAD7HUS7_9AGAR|nr:hypothetical protein DFH07DRAFT_851517 [Mycena maculata]
MSTTTRVRPPGSDLENVPYADFLGTWHVVASTLPLWKNKKNVAITYSTIPGAPATTFDDLVTYEMRFAKQGSTPSTVKGVDKLEVGAAGRWKWRGKGLLMIATSRWQLLGFHVSPPNLNAQSDEPEWVVTYFASTLFTPAGLDIYSRTKDGLSDGFIETMIEELGSLGGDVAGLVKHGGMFRVPHD